MDGITVTNFNDTHSAHGDAHAHDDGSKTKVGFWIYLMSDCIIFACLFATFGVLSDATVGGPTGAKLFELPFVFGETAILLASSFTFGLAMLKLETANKSSTLTWLVATFVLGAAFIGMEVYEFTNLVHEGAEPSVSAFLSSYFTLVGTHGLHVLCGLIWLGIMMHQIHRFGFDVMNRRRMACLSLFWHFLDLVWICVFTFVYLREFV